jgi:hypothetical protein
MRSITKEGARMMKGMLWVWMLALLMGLGIVGLMNAVS